MPARDLFRAYGLARSLVMYYGQPWKRRRMDRFYGQLVGEDALCFDIGSHVGNRVACWLRLGARVVAVEPQRDLHRFLERKFGKNPRVALEDVGVASERGAAEMLVSSRTPTVSTMSEDWISEVGRDRRFSRIEWDRRETVQLVTLDDLIERHGRPDFCKVDVEGMELAVLQGLTTPVPALSFEYIPVTRERAMACIDAVTALGSYAFRHSEVETMRWASGRWMSAAQMKKELWKLPQTAGSGDIYARLEDAR